MSRKLLRTIIILFFALMVGSGVYWGRNFFIPYIKSYLSSKSSQQKGAQEPVQTSLPQSSQPSLKDQKVLPSAQLPKEAFIFLYVPSLNGQGSFIMRGLNSLRYSVTWVLSPYLPRLDHWVKECRARGHSVLIALALEPAHYPRRDPGPLGIFVRSSPQQRHEKLVQQLSLAPGIVGVTYEGVSYGMTDPHLVEQVFQLLKAKKLWFVEPITTSGSQGPVLAQQLSFQGYLSLKKWISRPSLLLKEDPSQPTFPERIGLSCEESEVFSYINQYGDLLKQKGISLRSLEAQPS